ncbi:MAG: single-stranded-DNA-specific exonuclease RecJ [Anaerolineae bacterium]
MPKDWIVAPRLSDEHFARFPELSPLVVQLLHNRGVHEPQQMARFLERQPFHDTDPFQLKGMECAVERIHAAIRAGDPIAIFGDYDADGVAAAALLMQVLSALGARLRPYPYIPDRVEEGYGLNNQALDVLAQEGVQLVITVDCGIRSLDEAEYARALDLELIITDHHTPGDVLPHATAVINPKQPGCIYPFKQLTGVGVAFKLAQALLRTAGREVALDEMTLLDLVALGTVADVAPLMDENRALVARGLDVLNTAPRLGIRALMERAGVRMGAVTTHTLGYVLAPRLNAAGRLESAYVAYALLVAADATDAAALADQLEEQNRERQEITAQMQERARRFILADRASSSLYLIADPAFNEGIVGLVAARLTEEFYRPILIARLGSEVTRGSARSIPELHITQALDECAALLERYGGHSAAAGFTVRTANLLELYTRLLEIATRVFAERPPEPTLYIDTPLNLRVINRRAVEDVLTMRMAGRVTPGNAQAQSGLNVLESIERLQPFGCGNPEPLFVTEGMVVRRKQRVGGEGQHLKITLHDGKQEWEAIAFRQADWHDAIGERVDVAYHLSTNDYNGRRMLQLVVEDMHLA